jgi:hypothetical protein
MTCILPDCDAAVFIKKRQLCKRHYMRAWNAGEFGGTSASYRGRGTKRDYRVRHRHGLSPEQVASLMEAAGGCCEICGDSEALCIDHDHACCPGKRSCGQCVRGFLCRRCNVGIGMLGDDLERVTAAVAYLRDRGAKPARKTA